MKEDKSLTPEHKPKTKHRTAKKITESYLHNAGLYYLQRFASSQENFRAVMLRKVQKSCQHHKDQDFDKCRDMVSALIEKFKKIGLLDDALYTQGMVTSLRRQGKSMRAIVNTLKTKGVAEDLITEKLRAHDHDRHENGKQAEIQAALTLARKRRIGPFKRQDDPKYSEEKALAAMARAGFTYDTARIILKTDPAELDSFLQPYKTSS